MQLAGNLVAVIPLALQTLEGYYQFAGDTSGAYLHERDMNPHSANFSLDLGNLMAERKARNHFESVRFRAYMAVCPRVASNA